MELGATKTFIKKFIQLKNGTIVTLLLGSSSGDILNKTNKIKVFR